MKTRVQFLIVLWTFVALSFILFQNFTKDSSPVDLHNELCKQSRDYNQSQILNADSLASGLVDSWPSTTSANPASELKSMTPLLLKSNTQVYQYCLAIQGVRGSHLLALAELRALTNPETNPAWKKYLAALGSPINPSTRASR